MGACLLCGKSAGLFYSLHKNCYQQFQSTKAPIIELLAAKLEREPVDHLAQQLLEIVQQFNFVEEAQQRALVQAIETFAQQEFEREDYAANTSIAWVEFLDHIAIDKTLFLNTNFIVEQQCLPVLAILRAGKLPLCNCNVMQFPLELQANESLWWCFSNVRMDQLQPQLTKRKWSVAVRILENTLPAKPKRSVVKEELGTGKLWLTNQHLHFEYQAGIVSIAHQEISAMTPEFDGVTLQRKELQTRPQTFRCEDGRLLYQFLRYAQTINK